MNIEYYGAIKEDYCNECIQEVVIKAWEEGPPEWLSREDDDLIIKSCAEYDKWRTINYVRQLCFVIDREDCYIFSLCAKHLDKIVRKMKNKSNLSNEFIS